MKLFKCHHCKNLIYFENSICLNCNHIVGFDAAKLEMVTLLADQNLGYKNIQNNQESFKFCSNSQYQSCNWIIPSQSQIPFCQACNLNRTIPDLSIPSNLASWQKIEIAKHRLIYSMLRLRLPINSKNTNSAINGLAFDFKGNTVTEQVMTAHDFGLITINIDEAN